MVLLPASSPMLDGRRRGWALGTLSLGALMPALDGSIVNVALPSIKVALHLSDISLVWVVNAYFLTVGGFLLLGGRLGDIYGGRRLFLAGVALFTIASLVCGVATSPAELIGARALQGVGGAIVSSVSRGLALNLFMSPPDRARAMSIFSFVQIGGGTLGLVLGGYLIGAFGWHSIFLVNCPIGTLIFCAGIFLVAERKGQPGAARLDIGGALTVTASVLIALYAIGSYGQLGHTFIRTYSLIGGAVLFLLAFAWIEARVEVPLVPLHLLRLQNFVVANAIYILVSATAATWGFICTIYLQTALHLSSMRVSFAFLPVALVSAAYTLGLSARLIVRFGIRPSLSVGLLLATSGFLLFALMSESRSAETVITSMMLIGFGVTMVATPLMLAGTQDIPMSYSGLASGMLSTNCTIGAALGLAALAGIASARTNSLLLSGASEIEAIGAGYRLVSIACATILITALAGTLLFRVDKKNMTESVPEACTASRRQSELLRDTD